MKQSHETGFDQDQAEEIFDDFRLALIANNHLELTADQGGRVVEWTKEHKQWIEVGIGLVAAAGAGVVASAKFPPFHMPKFLSAS